MIKSPETCVQVRLGRGAQDASAELTDLITFLNSLVIFPSDDTASNLDPGNRDAKNFPHTWGWCRASTARASAGTGGGSARRGACAPGR